MASRGKKKSKVKANPPGVLDIVLVSAEVAPHSGASATAEVVRELARHLSGLGHQVRVFTPCFGPTSTLGDIKKNQLTRVDVTVGDRVESGAVVGKEIDGIQHRFVIHEAFFDRAGLFGDSAGPYVDNVERFSFFVRAMLRYLDEIAANVDLFHSFGWPASLVPVYLESGYTKDEGVTSAATVLSVGDVADQGRYDAAEFHDLNLDHIYASDDDLEAYGDLNLLRGGVVHADLIAAASPTYASEIQTGDFGEGLEELFARRSDSVVGILNGIVPDEWDPSVDRFLKARYDAGELIGKRSCKLDLESGLKMERNVDQFVVGILDLSEERGASLLVEAFHEIMKLDVHLVVVGGGERAYERFFIEQRDKMPRRLGVRLDPTEHGYRKSLAGIDAVLLPAVTAPRGLDAIRALRYGAVPIAHGVGGLADVVIPFGAEGANGFTFTGYDVPSMVGCIRTASELYSGDPDAWWKLVGIGMTRECSWESVSRQYVDAYKRTISGLGAKRSRRS